MKANSYTGGVGMRVVRAQVETSVVWPQKIEQKDVYLLSKQASYKTPKNRAKKCKSHLSRPGVGDEIEIPLISTNDWKNPKHVKWLLDVPNLEVFSCGDSLNFASKAIKFHLWFSYIFDALLVVILICNMYICYVSHD